jgi:hypothetical protein
MVNLSVSTERFTSAIKAFAEKTGRALSSVVKEQAILLAQRLAKLTYPASASQGKTRVAIDIGRVYVRNQWFEETFQFTKKSLQERISNLVRQKDEGALRAIFQNTSRLQLVRLEPFDASLHARMRKDGRVKVPEPRSFPVAQESQVKSLIREKQKNVGMAKSGWAQCASGLGKSIPAWLTKTGTGRVTDNTADKNPTVTLKNVVPYFGRLDQKASIVARAMEGRARAMAKSAEKAIELAKHQSGL